ncbi:MAG: hypothetical protein KGI70_01250 [Patescibacteria group bacterium]|nr:hypothetical protein [Patescibacteria group bacterium]
MTKKKSLGLLVGPTVNTYLDQIAKRCAPGNEAYRWLTSPPWYFIPVNTAIFGLLIIGYHFFINDLYWGVEAVFYSMVSVLVLISVAWCTLRILSKAPGEWREVSPTVLYSYVDPSKLGGLRAKIVEVRRSEPEAEFVIGLLMREYAPPVEGFVLIQTMRDLKTPCRLLVLDVMFFKGVQGRLKPAHA